MQTLLFNNWQGTCFQVREVSSQPADLSSWERRQFSPGQAVLFIQTLEFDQINRLGNWLGNCNPGSLNAPQNYLAYLLESNRLHVYQKNSVSFNADTTVASESAEGLLLSIQADLNLILAQERMESSQIEQSISQRSNTQSFIIHTKAAGLGILEAGKSLISWISEINDVVNPLYVLNRRVRAALEIYEESQDNHSTLPSSDWVERYLHNVSMSDHREIVEALGFDPYVIDLDTFSEVWHIAWVLTGDPRVMNMFTRFAKDYVGAQHSVEISRAGGTVVFDVLLTILLAATTAGAGLAASLGSNVRYASAFSRIATKLKSLARLLSGKPRQVRMHSRSGTDLKNEQAKHEIQSQETIDTVNQQNENRRREQAAQPRVIKEKYGTNEAEWTLDESGRPISVEAKLDTTYTEKRSSTEKDLQGSVGGDARLSDDDGGHMVGHRFMSDQGEKNLFPQNANLNRSAYKKMENEWADWTKEGYEVKLRVELDPPGSERPDFIYSDYDIVDPKTGNTVFKRSHEFSNQSGTSFNRVSRKDMKNYGS